MYFDYLGKLHHFGFFAAQNAPLCRPLKSVKLINEIVGSQFKNNIAFSVKSLYIFFTS